MIIGKRWRRIARRWQGVILPGLLMMFVVLSVRTVGWLQWSELSALDSFSSRCPVEGRSSNLSEPVVIVGVTETDLQALGGGQVPDQSLNQVVQQLETAGARVLGLNLFRDLPIEPGHADWSKTLQRSLQSPQSGQDSPMAIIGSEVALNPDPNLNVLPPPGLSDHRVGFTDVIVDADGHLRRSLLVARDWDRNLKLSLSLRLAQLYLEAEDFRMQPLERSTDPIRFNAVASKPTASGQTLTFPRKTENWGGYVRGMDRGNQLMLNFCAQQSPLPFIRFGDVLQGSFDPELVSDRVVLIGMTAASVKDIFFTDALRQTLVLQDTSETIGPPLISPMIYGVEYHAYATRQLIQVAQGQRPALHVWADWAESALIVISGLIGIILGIVIRSPIRSLLALVFASLVVLFGSYGLLLWGWWLPVVPMLLALAGAGLLTALFDRDAQFELRQRRLGVEQTYTAIHNGPLQQLALMVRQAEDQQQPLDALEVGRQLRSLDQSLRNIYERMRYEGTSRRALLYISGEMLNLEEPLPELLYQIYDLTLAEEMPGFDSIKDFVPPDFSPLRTEQLTLEQRRGLCLFLQEALLNVGRYTQGAAVLKVACSYRDGTYELRIYDDGQEVFDRLMQGREDRQARVAEKALRGSFYRCPQALQGTAYALAWCKASKFYPWRRSPKRAKSADSTRERETR